MRLFFVVRVIDGRSSVFLQPAHAKIFAWISSAIAGHAGAPAEIHELDAASAQLVPPKLIGRTLEPADLAALRRVAKRKKNPPPARGRRRTR